MRSIRSSTCAIFLTLVALVQCDGPDDAATARFETTDAAFRSVAAKTAQAPPVARSDKGRPEGPPGARDRGAELVYEKISHESDEGDDTVRQRGRFDETTWRRVARPWKYVAEGQVLNDEFWINRGEDGRVERGYRVRRRAIEVPRPRNRRRDDGDLRPDSKLGMQLRTRLSSMDDSAQLAVRIHVDAPAVRTELPLPPPLGSVGVDAHDRARAMRRRAIERQQVAFEAETAELTRAIVDAGGRVHGQFARSGWIAATVPAGALESLAANDAKVSRVLSEHRARDAGMPLGEMRSRTVNGVDYYRDQGYTGENGDYAPLTVGVTEVNGFEDEACHKLDYGWSIPDRCQLDDRVLDKFDCWHHVAGSECESVPNYGDVDQPDEQTHGTVVTSIIGADYTQGQAAGVNVGVGLGPGWEDKATGMAKEVNFRYYVTGTSDTGIARAYRCAQGIGADCPNTVDVTNTSTEFWNPDCFDCCNISSGWEAEAELENLFDDGILPVTISGNFGLTANSCQVTNIGDQPKGFTVGAVEVNPGPYNTWPRMQTHGNVSRGGADIVVDGDVKEGTMSIVDLAAIGEGFSHVTMKRNGDHGEVITDTRVIGAGVSWAAPMVAGAAIAVKDFFLHYGETWINYPGRLHTVMLAMGDRGHSGHASDPSCVRGLQIVCGADHYFGLGRLKLRLFDWGGDLSPHGFWGRTVTMTSGTTSTSKNVAFGAWPIPPGAELVKCVMQQHEDLISSSGVRDDISNIGLRVQLRQPYNGRCYQDWGHVYFEREDRLFDDKHMVAITDDEVNIENRCLQVELDPHVISSAGSVSFSTICYFAGMNDDEPKL